MSEDRFNTTFYALILIVGVGLLAGCLLGGEIAGVGMEDAYGPPPCTFTWLCCTGASCYNEPAREGTCPLLDSKTIGVYTCFCYESCPAK